MRAVYVVKMDIILKGYSVFDVPNIVQNAQVPLPVLNVFEEDMEAPVKEPVETHVWTAQTFPNVTNVSVEDMVPIVSFIAR